MIDNNSKKIYPMQNMSGKKTYVHIILVSGLPSNVLVGNALFIKKIFSLRTWAMDIFTPSYFIII